MASATLLDIPEYLLVVGGDFNQVCNITLDRSVNIYSGLDAPSGINRFMTELNIIDAWRLRNPLVKNYTFFSNRHKTFSRIDYIFVSPQLNNLIKSADILPIIISDYAPVVYTFELTWKPSKHAHRWQFNTMLLQNSEFLKQLRANLKLFLEINLESASSPKILWETTKCFIRGEAISFASNMKASRNCRIVQLENEIQLLEADQKRQFSDQKQTFLSTLKFELNNLLKSKAEFSIHRTRVTYYSQSESSSRLLAAKIKQNESFSIINAIETPLGSVTYDAEEINDTFRLFYSNLYESEAFFDPTVLKLYLSKLNLSSLSKEEAEFLDKSPTITELKDALSSMKRGKSPGLDGFPPELFLELWDSIGPLLLNSISYALSTGSFHREQNTSLISVLLS